MDVQWAGKAGTFGLMFALPLFLVGHADDDWHRMAEALAWVCVIPALVLRLVRGRHLRPDGPRPRWPRAGEPAERGGWT